MTNLEPHTTPQNIQQHVEVPSPANYEEYVAMAIDARERKEKAQWDMGEYAYKLTSQYGRNELYGKEILKKYAYDTGWDRKTLERYRRVYRVYKVEIDPNETEDLALSFTHFERASRTDDPVKWLIKASDELWTVAQLNDEIRKISGYKKEPNLSRCPHCGKEIDIDKLP